MITQLPEHLPAGMHWIAASLVSALFLGVYQLCTKHPVRENAVLPVLFLSNLCMATVWIALLGVQSVDPEALHEILRVEPLTLLQHGQLAVKSVIVAGSWVCGYFAVKHLPVSIGAPIRATSPLWTLAGALLILGERPGWVQLAGGWVGALSRALQSTEALGRAWGGSGDCADCDGRSPFPLMDGGWYKAQGRATGPGLNNENFQNPTSVAQPTRRNYQISCPPPVTRTGDKPCPLHHWGFPVYGRSSSPGRGW